MRFSVSYPSAVIHPSLGIWHQIFQCLPEGPGDLENGNQLKGRVEMHESLSRKTCGIGTYTG